jgi:methionine--tRNA ligase beta chain
MWFDRAHIVVGKVLEVAKHPKADKLYITRVTIGSEERQVVAGMRQHYTEQELAGKTVAVITNLEPAKLRGVESAGMILAFDEEGGKRIALVVPSGAAQPGERIVALGRPESTPAKSVSFKEFQRIEMRCHTVASTRGDSALVSAGGSALDVWAKAGLSAGMKVAVLTADAPALLATASGLPLTADREIADGARVR